MPLVPTTAQAITEMLGRFGVDVAALKVSPLDDDPALAVLWTRAIARTGRRTLPLEVGLKMPLGMMAVVDYLAAASATVGAALTVAQRVFPLVAPGVQLLLERLPSGVRRVVIVNQPPFPGELESDLLVLGILLARMRTLASRPLELPRLELAEPHPESRTRWVELLGTSRLRFGTRRTSLHFSASDWATPLRSADPRLLATLETLVGAEQRTGDALLVAVRALAMQRLPATPTIGEVAPALGLSVRSLQRRLALSGTSFVEVLDEVRRNRAEQLLDEGLLTLGEIAARVGFAEQASFTRAWQRWRGEAPSRSRRHGSASGTKRTPPASKARAR
ncbi:helix-turn-helix domain-containing protein [Archangium lansingense]|uniref:helix-turn-helix domain-containing protein n=1 Tax=Archangium lansingense TaxID=2995310 RepID=UPI003B7DC7C4